jgi:hypothetical protein
MTTQSSRLTVTFRPDKETLEALKHLEATFKAKDRSDIIRDAIRAYELDVLMNDILAACNKHGEESRQMVDQFEASDDGLPD